MLINERIRLYRKELSLSQEYIANLLGVPRTTVTAIESGERSIKANELMGFAEIFGVSSDELLYGKVKSNENTERFVRLFESLSGKDKKEVINLMEFKSMLIKEVWICVKLKQKER